MKLRGQPLDLALVLALLAVPVCAVADHWRQFTSADGLPEDVCVSLSLGAGGNILIRHAETADVTLFDGYEFSAIPAPDTTRNRIYESPGGQLWTVGAMGLLEFREGAWLPHLIPQVAAHLRLGAANDILLEPVRQGRVLIHLPDETLLLDASDPENPRVEPQPQTQVHPRPVVPAPKVLPESFQVGQVHDAITDAEGAVWLATSDGLFRQTHPLWEEATPPSVEEKTSPRNQPVPGDWEPPPGEWSVMFVADDGDEWFGGAHGIARIHRQAVQLFLSTNQVGPEQVVGFAQLPDGRLFCASPYKVWEFDGRDWLTLRSGFERIQTLHATRDATLWVATAQGVHRLARGAWISHGIEDGLPSADVRQVVEADPVRLMVETAAGWSVFRPRSDTTPPRTYLASNTGASGRFREGTAVRLAFHGRDRWNQTLPGRLLFSYRLDEREWSPFQESSDVTFTDLTVGNHYFQVRAMDRAGNVDPRPARLEFVVTVPWYREPRLVLILAVALVVALFFAAVAVNRHRRLQVSYAEVERQVAERTRELELANRELLHSQKMNALGTLTAGIAHDFNNILSIIKGSAQIIETSHNDPQEVRTRVDRIKTVVDQGAGVVKAMLGFSRASDEPPQPSDINALVTETLRLLGDRFLREVKIHFDPEPGLPAVVVTRDFVQQILLNFIFNAAEAMDDTKEIVISTQLLERLPPGTVLAPNTPGTDTAPGRALAPPHAAARSVAVSVEDFGCGITADVLPRIFEPFFTTKARSTRRGTGLGLSMAYELARKMGAGLAVESHPGEGSVFTLFFPVPIAADPQLVGHSDQTSPST